MKRDWICVTIIVTFTLAYIYLVTPSRDNITIDYDGNNSYTLVSDGTLLAGD
jgi:hypothetical protein